MKATTAGAVIFIVDDDPSVRKSLTRVVMSASYAVEAFASAREFMAREPFVGACCVVLDVRMPGPSISSPSRSTSKASWRPSTARWRRT